MPAALFKVVQNDIIGAQTVSKQLRNKIKHGQSLECRLPDLIIIGDKTLNFYVTWSQYISKSTITSDTSAWLTEVSIAVSILKISSGQIWNAFENVCSWSVFNFYRNNYMSVGMQKTSTLLQIMDGDFKPLSTQTLVKSMLTQIYNKSMVSQWVKFDNPYWTINKLHLQIDVYTLIFYPCYESSYKLPQKYEVCKLLWVKSNRTNPFPTKILTRIMWQKTHDKPHLLFWTH